ncbi:hypothetical protein [Gemmatimonas sp.]|jgi:predicted Zn-dependent protease|uniref:hypothetical protein n=1 Tax=Gemmatimonas sp. TaxID=1962908 RepID=UPI00391B36A3
MMQYVSRGRRWSPPLVPVAFAVSGLLLAGGCDAPSTAPTSFAYDPTALTAGQRYRWSNGRRVNVYVVPTSTGPYDLSATVNGAIARWNAVPDRERFTLQRTTNIAQANVIVFERGSAMPVTPPPGCPYSTTGASGYTYLCPINGRAALLPLTTDGPSGTATVLIRIDMGRITLAPLFDAVVTHELGHAVGIGGHSDSEADVMFASPRTSAISGRDTQTLRWLLAQTADVLLERM